MRNGGTGQKWEPEEDRLLAYWQSKLGNKWAQVAKHIPDRTGQQCAQRWRHTNPSISKGKWTAEEDEQLAQLVDTCGVGHWAEIARHMAGRTDQQCLARWTRHLDPSINRGNWSEQEDAMLLQLYEQYGSNWSRIAKAMKVRIPHQCRSRFNVLARGSASRCQSIGTDSQPQQQKRRRKGGAQFARVGAARWKKPKWSKADWEGESDSACDDEGTYDDTGDYHDEGMTNDNHQQDADEYADDAEEAAALLTSFQRSAGAAAVGHSLDTCVDTTDIRMHALGTEEQQQAQWQQQEWQQQQHWEKWQQRQKQQQQAVETDCTTAFNQDSAVAAASMDLSYRSTHTATALTQVLQVHRSEDATGAATSGQRGSSAGSSKSSSSNILDICRSRAGTSLCGVPSFPNPADYSRAIATAAAIADASSRNTSPEFVQQPVAPSGVGSSAAAAAAAAVAALLGSGGLAAAAAATAAPDASVPARAAVNGSVDAAALMAALSKYAASNAATEDADADMQEPQASAGHLSKTGSSSVPAGITGPEFDAAGPAAGVAAAHDAGKCTPVFTGTTVTAVMAAAASEPTAAAAPQPAGALALGSGSTFVAAEPAVTAGPGKAADYVHAVQAGGHAMDNGCVATAAAATAPSSSQQLLLRWLKSETGEQAPAVDPLPVLPLQLSCQQQQLLQQQPTLQQQLVAATPGLQQLAALYTSHMPTQQQQQQPQSILSQALQQLGILSGVQQQHGLQPTASVAGLSGNGMGSYATGGLDLVDMVRILAAAQPPAAV